MDRLLSLLAAVLLIRGIYVDSVNRVNDAGGSAGHFAPVGDSIEPSPSEGNQGGNEGIGPAIPESRAFPGPDNKGIAKVSGNSRSTAKVMSRFNRPADYRMEVTAYTWTGNRTKSETWPEVGCVAVDPTMIPLGTKLYIEGYGFAEAMDTGGLIKAKWNRPDPKRRYAEMDVFFETRAEAIEWGRPMNVKVWRLD